MAARRTYIIKCDSYGEETVYTTSTRKSEIESRLYSLARYYKKENTVIWHNIGHFEVIGMIKAEYWITVA